MVNVFGREVSTPVALGGIALAGGGILWYRHNKKNQANTQTQNQQPGIDPATGQPYATEGIDPNTGIPYNQEYGNYTYQPEGSGYGPYGLDTYGSGGSGAFSGMGYYGGGVPYNVQQQATTNAQWTQAAVSALTAQGYNGMTVLAALGLFLTGGHLTSDQAAIVQAAIAAEGYPPQGPNTINQAPTGNPVPPAQPISYIAPNVIKMTGMQAANAIAKVGLRPSGNASTTLHVYKQDPSPGTYLAKGSTVAFWVK